MGEDLLNEDIKRCFSLSKECIKKQDWEGALDYKLKEISIINVIPDEYFIGKIPKRLEIARGYSSAARFALRLGKEKENKRYLLKAFANFWKLHKEGRLRHYREVDDLMYCSNHIKKVYGRNSNLSKKIEERRKEVRRKYPDFFRDFHV